MNTERLSQIWNIPADAFGLRADVYLQRKLGRISRVRAQSIIASKDFLLDEQKVKPSQRLKVGQKASLFRFAPDYPEDINDVDIKVIEDHKNFIVLNKPHGINVHPSANSLYKTITYWLKINYPQYKINLSHRLDKDTSGVIICAKTVFMDRALKQLFFKKKVIKIYLAIVKGHVKNSAVIDLALDLSEKLKIRMQHNSLGKKAITKIRPVKYFPSVDRTLVMCRPYTGRQHQIRAHLSLINHPLVGDKLYGQTDEFFKLVCQKDEVALKKLEHNRHALHAYKLKLNIDNKFYIFKAELPEDLVSLISD